MVNKSNALNRALASITFGLLLSACGQQVDVESSNEQSAASTTQLLPTDGLVLHLESDSGVTDSQNIVTDWEDQSGHDNSLTSIGSPRIEYSALNGQPVIELNNPSSLLVREGGVDLPEDNADRTVTLLVNYSEGEGGFFYGSEICNSAFKTGITADGLATVLGYCEANNVETSENLRVGEWIIQTVVLGDSVLTQYLNGEVVSTTTHNFDTVADRLAIGAPITAPANTRMSIAAAFVWERALSAEELEQSRSYLVDKYLPDSGNTVVSEDSSESTESQDPSPTQDQPIEVLPPVVPNPSPETDGSADTVIESPVAAPAPVVVEQPDSDGADNTPVVADPVPPEAPAPEAPAPEAPAPEATTPEQPALPSPSVSLLLTNMLNDAVQLEWSATNADSCVATGSWNVSGLPTAGTEIIQNAEIGDSFQINCQNADGASAISLVTVSQRLVRFTWLEPTDRDQDITHYGVHYGSSQGSYDDLVLVELSNEFIDLSVDPGKVYLTMSVHTANGQKGATGPELQMDIN